MPSLLALFGLALLVPGVLAFLALYTLLLLFTPRPPIPSASETTYLSPASAPSDPQSLPSLVAADAKQTVELSVVVPAYNESVRLGVMLRPAIEFLETRSLPEKNTSANEVRDGPQKGSYEVLLVDDGSKDGTAQVALDLARQIAADLPGGAMKRGGVKVCRLVRNRGKGGATKHGVLHSSAHPRHGRILFVDADGATTFTDLALLEEELEKLVSAQDPEKESHGLVVGSRAHLVSSEAVVKRSLLRNLLMRGFHTYLSLLGLSSIRDTQCGFKLFTAPTASLLFPSLHSPGWIFDCELLLLALRCGVPVREVGVRWHEVDGSKLDVVRDSVRMARDLLVIRGNYLLGRWKAPRTVGEVEKGKEGRKER
ncbi:hypothetical protein JCM10213_007534 [Rhodosporidiobolus nylandii]